MLYFSSFFFFLFHILCHFISVRFINNLLVFMHDSVCHQSSHNMSEWHVLNIWIGSLWFQIKQIEMNEHISHNWNPNLGLFVVISRLSELPLYLNHEISVGKCLLNFNPNCSVSWSLLTVCGVFVSLEIEREVISGYNCEVSLIGPLTLHLRSILQRCVWEKKYINFNIYLFFYRINSRSKEILVPQL